MGDDIDNLYDPIEVLKRLQKLTAAEAEGVRQRLEGITMALNALIESRREKDLSERRTKAELGYYSSQPKEKNS